MKTKTADVEKLRGVWLPCADAYEAGLWMFYILEDRVVAISRPAMQAVGQQLHCENGPAVSWPWGESYYFLNGVNVDKEIVMTPADQLDANLLLRESNAEIRREIVRKIGIERVCQDLKATCVDKQIVTINERRVARFDGEEAEIVPVDHPYELLLLHLGDGRVRPFLKMTNPSIGVYHIEGVGPECRTVEQALHWRKPDVMRDIPIDDEHGEEWQQQGDVVVWPLGAKALKRYPSILT